MRLSKVCFILLSCYLPLGAFTQTALSAESQVEIIKRQIEVNNQPISMVAIVNEQFHGSNAEQLGISVGTLRGNIVTLKVPVDQAGELIDIQGIEYLKVASNIGPNLDRLVADVRADSVHQAIDLPMAYTGKDVLVGVTDWGFDYTHPMFYDSALVETRVLAAWDQYKTLGPSPANFDYGTVYESSSELLNAESDTANIYSYSTHGSHVAGIAAGGGAATEYHGLAYNSQLLFATFLVDEGAVIDAIEWMYQKALDEEKRLVINMSWGLYYFGTLDGTSVMSEVIKTYSDLDVVFVTSGGNNGDRPFHIGYSFNADTMKTRVGYVPNNSVNFQDGQSISCWSEPGKPFSIQVEILDNANNSIGESSWYSTASAAQYTVDSIIIGSDTYRFDLTVDQAHPRNQRPHIRLRVDNPPTGKVVLNATANSGTVHFWNVLETTTGVGNTGWDFLTVNSNYTAGDNEYGIGEPAASREAISVGAYLSNLQANDQVFTYGIANFSSLGPTLDGRIKPDICAPGVSVASSLSRFSDGGYTPLYQSQFNGETYGFVRFSGTSMSSPAVAGIVALMLEANPDLSPAMVKEILQETARTDDKTGIIPAGGNNTWGHGKVNAYAAVKRAQELNAVETSSKPASVSLYPNPAREMLHVKSEWPVSKIEVWSIDGRKILETSANRSSIPTQEIPLGVYHIWVYGENGQIELKGFVKQ